MRRSSLEALCKGLGVGSACAAAAACSQGSDPGKQEADLGAVDISDYSQVVVETGFSSENAESVRSAVMTILTSKSVNGYPGMLYPELATSPTFSLAIYGDCDQLEKRAPRSRNTNAVLSRMSREQLFFNRPARRPPAWTADLTPAAAIGTVRNPRAFNAPARPDPDLSALLCWGCKLPR